MSYIFIRRAAKRVLSNNAYLKLKRYYERLSPRGFLFMLPHELLSSYKYPSLLSIALTTRCNLSCFICRREQIAGGDLEFDNIYKLEKAIRYARAVSLTGMGETLLYPRFEDVLSYIYFLNNSTRLIRVFTNGTKLSERIAKLLSGHLDYLRISLHAATAETYNRDMKYGDFDQTITAIRLFMGALNQKDRQKIKLHFVAHTENFHEIPKFVLLAEALGISMVTVGQYVVTTAAHHQYCLLNVKQEYNEVVNHAQDLASKRNLLFDARRFFSETKRPVRECLSPFNECYIDVRGNIEPCCFSGYTMGNVYKTSFEEIWFGESYFGLRKERHLAGCRSCSPFVSLDEYSAHFGSGYKRTSAYIRAEQVFKNTGKIP